jgi:hypothetical protein
MKRKMFLLVFVSFASCDISSNTKIPLKELKRSDGASVKISFFGNGPVGSQWIGVKMPSVGDTMLAAYENYDSLAYASLKSDTVLLLGLTTKLKFGDPWIVHDYEVKLPADPKFRSR